MSDDFETGKVYFTFGFMDKGMKYPVVTSLVYLGKNLEGDEGRDFWFFQDVDSYFDKGGYPGGGEPIERVPPSSAECVGQIYTYTTESVSEILDADGLIAELSRLRL